MEYIIIGKRFVNRNVLVLSDLLFDGVTPEMESTLPF